VGSANFTRRGLGVLRDPLAANIEAGVLMRWMRGKWHPKELRPPIQGQIIDWASCGNCDLRDPSAEEEKTPDWADFIHCVELTIRWERLPECRMSPKAAGRALIPMGLQCSMPRFVTIYATVPGKILRFCQNCWHKPTPTSACQGSALLMRSAEGQTSFLRSSGERPAHERSTGFPSTRQAIWSWYRSVWQGR